MTCIVALVAGGITYFAADSFVGNVPDGYHTHAGQTIRNESKIWTKNGMVFGGNGDTRMLQLLHYMHDAPLYTRKGTKVEYLVKEFIPSLQECFSKNRRSADKLDGGILVSIEGALFTIGPRFEVCDTADPYETVGLGGTGSVGALHTTELLGVPPLQRLYLALAAGQHYTCVVEPPFYYITNEMTEPKVLEEQEMFPSSR